MPIATTQIGHVYKIVCVKNPSIAYVGSTFYPLSSRWKAHVSDYKQNRGCSIKKCFDEYGIENFNCELIKSYNVVRTDLSDRKHLMAYEQLWINKLKCVNVRDSFTIPYIQTIKISDKGVRFYIENREQCIAKVRARQSIKTTCTCGIPVSVIYMKTHVNTNKHRKKLEYRKRFMDKSIYV